MDREVTKKEKKKRSKASLDYLNRNPWIRGYNRARSRCLYPRDSSYYKYGAVGIQFLMTIDDFKELWFRDRADLMEHPSIDRIDSKKHYSKDNCRYLELYDNWTRQNPAKKVAQHTKSGELVKIWDSVSNVIKSGINRGHLNSCLKNIRKSAYGYKWSYA